MSPDQPSNPTLPLNEQSDSWLIGECLKTQNNTQQDNRFFRELVSRYAGLVFNMTYRMTNNRELSEEITQDTFVKTYQHLAKFDTSKTFKPWLLRIASNTTISELRRRSNKQQSSVVSMSALEEDGWQLPDQVSDSQQVVLERQLADSEILALLNTLDEKYRQVLVLRYLKDLSYEEVSESLGIPLNTVRTWIRRGLESLRTELGKHPELLTRH